MKKLFIHHPLFRVLSPIFSGFVVYLLLLLINNDIEQLYDQFLGEELYVCIGLSFIIQELSRLLLLGFKKLLEHFSGIVSLSIQIITSLFMSVLVVTLTISIYYNNVLGYSPDNEELWLFNSIFSVLTLIYILIFTSHHYLYKINTEKINEELLKKQLIEEDFTAFKNNINPTLLFESLESIIILTEHQKERVDKLIDYLAITYRYILSKDKIQLISINEELQVLNQFVLLINHLQYSKVKLVNHVNSDFLIVPGSLLKIIEFIVKKSIVNLNKPLEISLLEQNTFLIISYIPYDKIVDPLSINDLKDIKRVYNIYSNTTLQIEYSNTNRQIKIPKLTLK